MVLPSVLNGRIYRAAFIPLLFALVVAGFSLTDRPGPLTTSLAPDAFDGARAFGALEGLAARFPDRRPGGAGDQGLAAYMVRDLGGLGGTSGGGFSVAVRHIRAQTIDGERTLTTVIAQRPGTTGAAPIVILAHRDAAGRNRSEIDQQAQLSGTAVLLELARVFAAGETQRTIVLVSTSGGSGGNAGAADFAAHPGGPVDAAIVLGDLAGKFIRGPLLATFSDDPGSAPALLQRTVSEAIAQQAGVAPGGSGELSQLAHLAFPLAAGEQAPLDTHGLPAVLVQTSGEEASTAREPASAGRLEGLGRAVLSAVYALDAGPEVPNEFETGLPIQHKVIPEWALRLLIGALLLPPLLVALDSLARMRRRRRRTQPSGTQSVGLYARAPDRSVGIWTLWTLACALPFLACALFAILLGALGMIGAPYPPVSSTVLPFDGPAVEAVLATALVLLFSWLAWPALMRRLSLPIVPGAEDQAHPTQPASPAAATIGMLLVLSALALVVWAVNPFTALLLVPALHLWLLLASPERGATGRFPPRAVALTVVALGLAPLMLLVAFYANQLELGPGGVAHTALLLLAGGRIGIVGSVLWSVAFGCLAAALLIALVRVPAGGADIGGPDDGLGAHELRVDRSPITRGPLSYAGPGSLGGTESALRR
jgi:hypothetical protein